MTSPIAIFRNVVEPFGSAYVDWNLGTLCNYACSYCPERLHDGALKWPAVDLASRFCERVVTHYGRLGKRTIFKFTGGEPTLYKHLIELLCRIKALGGETGVNSNGSRELAWWDRATEHLDFVVLTHHVEFTATDHFVAVANRLLERGVAVHVNVTMLPERFDECVRNVSALWSQCNGISITLKPLLVNFKDQLYPYSVDHMRTMQAPEGVAADEDVPSGGMCCIHADGTSRVVQPQDFILRDANHWSGWNCNAGIESLAVRADGEVFRAVCQQEGTLGNLRDHSLSLPVTPIRCAKESCACLADIKISKWRGDDPSLKALRSEAIVAFAAAPRGRGPNRG
jgi:MoaA/NifB/PqqE/SkfB family radical SAM enzyme